MVFYQELWNILLKHAQLVNRIPYGQVFFSLVLLDLLHKILFERKKKTEFLNNAYQNSKIL